MMYGSGSTSSSIAAAFTKTACVDSFRTTAFAAMVRDPPPRPSGSKVSEAKVAHSCDGTTAVGLVNFVAQSATAQQQEHGVLAYVAK